MHLDPTHGVFVVIVFAVFAAFLYLCHRWLPANFMGWRGVDSVGLPEPRPTPDTGSHSGGD
jgi:hypothetical protein